jgi:hypothetical protein
MGLFGLGVPTSASDFRSGRIVRLEARPAFLPNLRLPGGDPLRPEYVDSSHSIVAADASLGSTPT